MPLCLAAGTLAVALGWDQFTLAWTHSIEKIRWEEDYRVEAGALLLTEARIRGSGAGMEPPDGARLDAQGVWHYRPALPPLPALRLTQSPYTAGYELCHDGRCRPLADFMPGLQDGVIVAAPCSSESTTRPSSAATTRAPGPSTSTRWD
ncbi:DUF1850 domain-containing protein [Pelomonas sp. KK5]|uniref:DUF1850 domain-containing protein n=1 Tax=Pelomonas sp. KK5 TaxID=1855730 RepID=UPI00097CBE9B|nr:DUF1850 domain-containing protein [Pelomonas sp. KK5]